MGVVFHRQGPGTRRSPRWQGSSIEVDGAKDDFVFELLFYLTVAVESSTHFSATLILRPLSKSGPSVPLFPGKPGHKKNFSFLNQSKVPSAPPTGQSATPVNTPTQ